MEINTGKPEENLEVEKKPSAKAKGICVVLEDDIDKGKLEDLLLAIKQFRHVLTAEFIDSGFDDHVNRIRVKEEIQQKMKDIIVY